MIYIDRGGQEAAIQYGVHSKVRNIEAKLILVVILLMGIFLISCESEQEKRAGYLIEQCKKLKIGMTYAMVIEIMGRPIQTIEYRDEGRIKEVFVYPSPAAASTFTQCVLDKEADRVEEIICGENYWLTKALVSS